MEQRCTNKGESTKIEERKRDNTTKTNLADFLKTIIDKKFEIVGCWQRAPMWLYLTSDVGVKVVRTPFGHPDTRTR